MDFTFILVVATILTGIFSLIRSNSSIFSNIRELSASIFPVLLFVLVIRSFFFEPYKIPSGSMIPTLMIGDFILVDKNIYGYKLPLSNITLIENQDPKRGDVVVFKYPENMKINYIKRVIALPGDTVIYKNKRLFINNNEYTLTKFPHSFDPVEIADGEVYRENNSEKEYLILNQTQSPFNFKYTVPSDTFFVMGDNRDNSNDSTKDVGFVPRENFFGRADYIWMTWECWTCLPSFEKVGRIN